MIGSQARYSMLRITQQGLTVFRLNRRFRLYGPCAPPKGVTKAALYCAHRTSTVSSCAFCEQEGHLATPFPSFRGRALRGQRRPNGPSILHFHFPHFALKGGRQTFLHYAQYLNSPILFKDSLVDPRLHASFSPAQPGARREVLFSRASTLLSPTFRKYGAHQAVPFSNFSPLRPQREWPRLPFTARIERPRFHRGGSASKKGTWPLPLLIPNSLLLLKGSLVDPRLRASNEHIPIVRVPRAGGRSGWPSSLLTEVPSSWLSFLPLDSTVKQWTYGLRSPLLKE
jgi:hypothetical protein